MTSPYNPPERTSRVLPPCPFWQDGSVDLFGPLPAGERITVVVDYFSRFAEGAIYKTTIQAKIISYFSYFFLIWCAVFFAKRQRTTAHIRRPRVVFFRMHDNWAFQSYTVVATRQQWGWTPESFTGWILAGCTSGEDQLTFRANFDVDCLIDQPLKSLLQLHVFGRELRAKLPELRRCFQRSNVGHRLVQEVEWKGLCKRQRRSCAHIL